MTLTEFLLARIAEDEGVARDDYAKGMSGFMWKHFPKDAYDELQRVTLERGRRLARECEAKRRIVEWHKSWPVLVRTQPEFTTADPNDPSSTTFRMSQQIAWATEREYREKFGDEPPTGPVLRFLALPYADHPDYRQEWKP